MLRRFLRTALLIFLAMLGASTPATPQAVASFMGEMDCDTPAVAGRGCLLLLAPGVSLGAVRAKDASSDARRPSQFSNIYELGSNDLRYRPQALILVDTSTNAGTPRNARDATLGQIRAAVLALVDTLPAKTEMAMLFYDQDVETVVEFGGGRDAIARALDDLAFDGLTTRTFDAISRSVGSLAARRALSRNIYLFTDGIAEDAASSDGVVSEAREAGVAISTMIFHWQRVGTPDRGGAETIFSLAADATGGVLSVSEAGDSPAFDPEFAADVRAQQEASGVIRVPGVASSTTIEVDLVREAVGARRKVLKLTELIEVRAPAPPRAPPLPFWKAPWFIPVTVGVLVLLLSIALLWFALRRGRRAAKEETADADEAEGLADHPAEGEIAGAEVQEPVEPGAVLAGLRMSNGGQVYDIRVPKLSIGRADENEIVLKDESISRIHCELHMTRQGRFAITDLQSLNQTRVNGEPVSTRVLSDGDLIRLGEIELAFRAGPG
ncbi:MAG: FHA domain-containing protein [Pseudomonadota bacterium]